jgi:uncharacterized protein YbjT (DUF2867 family)
MQPIASDDVAAAPAEVATAEPKNGTVEIAGPELIRMDEFVRRFLVATKDTRQVSTDPEAPYYGIDFYIEDPDGYVIAFGGRPSAQGASQESPCV